jgi:putative SOS response-associated peptidase YedK
MCNEYELETQWEEYERILAREELRLPTRQTELDLLRKPSIKIGDTGTVIRAAGNGVELAPMKFGFPPPRPRAGPVFNFRSEGRHFGDSNRCLIPASAFFEFTGEKYPKTRHRFRMIGEPVFAIAGLWRKGDAGEAFTMLTTEPGPDIEPIHDRQIVVLQPGQWTQWLYLARPEAELLQPLPAGTLETAVQPRVGQ